MTSTTKKSTPPKNINVIDHPDLVTMRSRNPNSNSRNSTDFSSGSSLSFRHPAIPEEPNNLSDFDLAEKSENLSDLYDVVPEVLPPEEEDFDTDFMPASVNKNPKRGPPPTFMRPVSSRTYMRSRSHSLPAVHGNFKFINREAANRLSNSECCDDDLNKKIRFGQKRNPPHNIH